MLCAFSGGAELPDVTSLRETLHGVKGVFLLKNGEVLDSDVVFGEEMKYLSKSIPYFVEAVCDTKDDIKKFSIAGNDLIFIFFREPYALGIIAEPSVNVPLLEVMAGEVLEQGETPEPKLEPEPKEAEEASEEGEVRGKEEETPEEEKEIPASYLKLKEQLLG